MSQPTDSFDSPREQRASVALALLFIAMALFIHAVLLFDHATGIAAQIVVGAAAAGGVLPDSALLVVILAIPALILLGWGVCAGSCLRAIATEAPSTAARTIAVGAPLSALIAVVLALVVDSYSSVDNYRLYNFFVTIVGSVVMVEPVVVGILAMSAVRERDQTGVLALARAFWRAHLIGLLPAIIAGAIIGWLSFERQRREDVYDMVLEMVLPLTVGVWAYWQGFQLLRAASGLIRRAPSPSPSAKS